MCFLSVFSLCLYFLGLPATALHLLSPEEPLLAVRVWCSGTAIRRFFL